MILLAQLLGPMMAQAAPTADAASAGYFMPQKSRSSAIVEDRLLRTTSPVIDSHLINDLPPPPKDESFTAPLPWYKTDWGVASIGIVSTGISMIFDRTVNNYTTTHISTNVRQHIALRMADSLELAPLAFAGLTMVQSPISSPKLAHASSIAFTSAAEVTLEVMALKYVIGRDRPGGAGSDPFVAQPFDAPHSTFSIGAVFPGAGNPTSSFPSGHTALAFALVTPYAELYHQPLLYALPVAVGLGRVAAQDGHWLSDVVGGAFIGWLTADLTRRYFPNSDYGLMLFGDGRHIVVGINGRF